MNLNAIINGINLDIVYVDERIIAVFTASDSIGTDIKSILSSDVLDAITAIITKGKQN